MLGVIAQGMVAAGLALMIFNIISVVRFIRTQEDVLTDDADEHLTYVVLAFVACFALVYAFIFFQRFAKLSIGLILLSGSAFVTFVLQWIYRLVNNIKNNTISMAETLSTVIDARDRDLRGHSRHVELLSLLIYDALPEREREGISRTNLRYAAVFHDLGKMGVPEAVLNKPGRLNADDWNLIRQHPNIGADILAPVTSFEEILSWIRYHHERVDGQGYYHIPLEEIPLAARIITVADTFSAVLMRRPYKEPTSYDESIQILKDAAGTQLDAHLVDVFCAIPKERIMACSYVLGDAGNGEAVGA